MRSIEDINADSRANEVPPIDLIGDFLEHVHPGNFQETYGLLTTKLQRQVLDHAIDNRANFDVVLDEIRSKGETQSTGSRFGIGRSNSARSSRHLPRHRRLRWARLTVFARC